MARLWCRFIIIVVVSGIAAGARSMAAPIYLVTGGKSEFGICVDSAAGAGLMAHVDTLRRYVREVSGADLSVTHRLEKAGHQIVIEVGRSRDRSLHMTDFGNDGFRIKTIEGCVYLTAKSEYGAQNAIYTFLESYLGCRRFSPWVTLIPKRESITLGDLDDTQVPRITFRMQDFKEPAYNTWHKLNSNADFGLFVHTFKTLVPPERYFKGHPEYFSVVNGQRMANGQLCLSHPDVLRIVVDELRARMKARPEATFWSVSQNDTYAPCECSACRSVDSAEGSQSGSILAFVNKVADEFPDKTISTLAYQYSRSAPKHLKPRPNVNIMLCSIECDRSKPLVDNPSCVSFVNDVQDWAQLTKNIFLWDYVIQFRNLVSPFPNLQTLQPNIQFFVQNGISTVFEQGLATMRGEFAELRAYLISKLLWNPDINIDSVMEDFLTGYYGPASPFVRAYIDTMHAALRASGEGLAPFGYPWPSKDGYLSPRMLETYGGIFDRAEEAVKDNPELLSRVQTARLPLQFVLLEQAKINGAGERGCFVRGDDGTLRTRPEIDTLLTTFVEQCRVAEIPRLWEHGTSPGEYYASTRRFLDESTKDHLGRLKQVTLTQPASPKYHNGEASALTDGFKGWEDYNMHWLGFEGEDMDATIDLGAVQTVKGIGTDFLQDINSWVFMPVTVEFLVSEDGKDFQVVGQVNNSTTPEKDGAVIAPYEVRFEALRARYVRVKAVNIKTCPAWHKGAGGKAWIFIDEIRVL
jgi:hypothetical protein